MSPNNFNEYLQNMVCDKNSKNEVTHTNIGSKKHNIYGASYTINNNEEFLNLYFKQLKLEENYYLTEKQLNSDNRMLVVDMDFRYNKTIKTRQHNEETIKDIINLYGEKINEIFKFDYHSKVTAFVMEKPNVNILEDKTKDGIHIIFTLKMKTEEQMLLRRKILNNIKLDLPLTNSFDDVLDIGITKGSTPWQLYGSKKPNNEAYKLTYTYDILFNTDMEDFEIKTNNTFDIEKDYEQLSARYENHMRFMLNDSEFLIEALKSEKEALQPKEKKMIVETPKDETTINNNEKIINLIKPETLGKFEDWKKIIFAMKNEGFSEEFARQTSDRGIGDFTPLTEEAWEKIWNAKTSQLTMGTLRYYAKRDSPDEYKELNSNEFYYDLWNMNTSLYAEIFMKLEGEKIIYNKNNKTYNVYVNDEWINDNTDGNMIGRNLVYKTLINYYKKLLEDESKILTLLTMKTEMDEDDKFEENRLKCKIQQIEKNINYIGDTTIKNKIFTEVKGLVINKNEDIIFDIGEDNHYNIQFKNGLYDIKQKKFRKRTFNDYVTQKLDYDYIEKNDIDQGTHDFVKNIFEKIHPDENERKFQLSYLALCLTGNVSHQIMKMNIGYSASNAKSTETAIHQKCLPIYTCKLDRKTFTQGYSKRHKQYLQLIENPIRLAYIEELDRSKMDIEELKNIVDGRELDVEIMYGTTRTSKHQAHLMSASNKDFNMDTDEGILRRVKIQMYNSKFVDKHDDLKIDESKHIYEKILNFENIYFNDSKYKNAYIHLLLEHVDQLYIPKSATETFKEIASEYNKFDNLIYDKYKITKDENDCISKEDICIYLEKYFEWEYALNEFKRMGLKYDRTKKKNKQRGFIIGIKELPIEPDDETNDDKKCKI
jgi:hypothetical protein